MAALLAIRGLMDIGVYWSGNVLEHKLERLDTPGDGPLEEVWNCRRLPQGLGKDAGGDRLFVASGGYWIGFFRLVPEVLINPNDPRCPYTLIFDLRSWRGLSTRTPRRPFRGWTYDIPEDSREQASARD